MAEQEHAVDEHRPPWGRIIVVALVALALILFVVQNTASTEISWLFFSGEGPLWIIIVVVAVLGAVLSEVIGWMVRRNRRKD